MNDLCFLRIKLKKRKLSISDRLRQGIDVLLLFYLTFLKYPGQLEMMQDIADLLFHDKLEKREKWMRLFDDPIWKPIYDAPLPVHRDLAYRQLKKVADSGLVSVLNFVQDPTNIFTAHEMLGTVSPSTTTKFTVQFNLFGGSIVGLQKTPDKALYKKLDSMEIVGCFCLTELGYGNNAIKMETTSTYDQKTKQFVVNSPTVLSQKYWITNGGIHAHMAVVMAQTIVKGKNEGINAFLVPIRDKNLKQLEGVQIREMGQKIGLNGVDNATLSFHNVRIPRTNMMNKYSDITEDGQFKSQVKGIQQRFFKVTERLLSGRLCIASMTIGSLKRALYTAIKYSKQRCGVSKNGKSETPIFQYQLQQNTFIPIIARALGLFMLHNYAKTIFANQKGHEHDISMICSVDKTLVGWHSAQSIITMRERCGGQGFLAANTFGDGIAGSQAALTAEGDNRVLMVKVVKDMLKIFSKNPKVYYNGEFKKFSSLDQLKDLNNISTLLQMKHKHLLLKFISLLTQLRGKGLSNFDILMFNTSDEIQSLALSFGEMLAWNQCLRSLEKLNQGKSIMAAYYLLFAWDIIIRDMATLLLEQWITPQLAKSLRQEYNQMIKAAAEKVDNIIESLNLPLQANFAPIANDYVLYNSQPNYGEVINAKM